MPVVITGVRSGTSQRPSALVGCGSAKSLATVTFLYARPSRRIGAARPTRAGLFFLAAAISRLSDAAAALTIWLNGVTPAIGSLPNDHAYATAPSSLPLMWIGLPDIPAMTPVFSRFMPDSRHRIKSRPGLVFFKTPMTSASKVSSLTPLMTLLPCPFMPGFTSSTFQYVDGFGTPGCGAGRWA